MGAMQRRKGAGGEREAAAELKRLFPWIAVSRSARNGVDAAEDLHHSIPNVHFEVKRCETLSLYPAVEQAIFASSGKYPIVLHRRNGKKWLAIVQLDSLREIVRALSMTEPMSCPTCVHASLDGFSQPCSECKVDKEGTHSKWEDGRLPFDD